MERSYGKVSRTLRLPVGADAEHANAVFENGVLSITFPKISTPSTGKKLLVT